MNITCSTGSHANVGRLFANGLYNAVASLLSGRRIPDLTSGFRVVRADKFKQFLEDSRLKVAEQLGVSANEIALTRNTSEANNIINNGLNLETGDEVVLWDQNHPTNNVAWEVRAARFGLAVKKVKTPDKPRDAGDLIKPFKKALGPNTRVLTLTHASNLTGVRLPIRVSTKCIC